MSNKKYKQCIDKFYSTQRVSTCVVNFVPYFKGISTPPQNTVTIFCFLNPCTIQVGRGDMRPRGIKTLQGRNEVRKSGWQRKYIQNKGIFK
jgi:hypothetical protein